MTFSRYFSYVLSGSVLLAMLLTGAISEATIKNLQSCGVTFQPTQEVPVIRELTSSVRVNGQLVDLHTGIDHNRLITVTNPSKSNFGDPNAFVVLSITPAAGIGTGRHTISLRYLDGGTDTFFINILGPKIDSITVLPSTPVLSDVVSVEEGARVTITLTGSGLSNVVLKDSVRGNFSNIQDISRSSSRVAFAANIVSAVVLGTGGVSTNTFQVQELPDSCSENRVGGSGKMRIAVVVKPSLTISDGSITEGTDLVFNLTLSKPSFEEQGASVNFETSPGTASAGIACGVGDYIPSFGRVVFSAKETTKTIAVKTCSDTFFERNESFTVTLSNPIGLNIADSSGTGTILNKFIVPSPTDPIGPITPPPSKPPAPGTPPPEPPVIPPAPPAPPDLAVSIQGDPAIQRLGEGRKNVTVTVVIQNIGRGASVPCNNEVLLNDNVKATFTLDSIPANGRVTKSVSFETQQNGTNKVKVKVDTDDRNAEVLEDNNRAAVDIEL